VTNTYPSSLGHLSVVLKIQLIKGMKEMLLSSLVKAWSLVQLSPTHWCSLLGNFALNSLLGREGSSLFNPHIDLLGLLHGLL
jgi:hypothetical protein